VPSFSPSVIDDFEVEKLAAQSSSFHLCLEAAAVGAFEGLAACCYFK